MHFMLQMRPGLDGRLMFALGKFAGREAQKKAARMSQYICQPCTWRNSIAFGS